MFDISHVACWLNVQLGILAPLLSPMVEVEKWLPPDKDGNYLCVSQCMCVVCVKDASVMKHWGCMDRDG